jgi:hypothetical protein
MMNRVKKSLLSLQANRLVKRRLVSCLTLLEMIIVVSLVAGLSSAIMLPVWKGWKKLQLGHQENQIHAFFKEVYALMLMSQSEMKLELREEEDRQKLMARGCLLDEKIDKINIVLDSGLHLRAKGLHLNEPVSWVLSPLAEPEEIVFELKDASGRSRQWKERLPLWQSP